MTLLEVMVCLAVLGLFATGFIRHLAGTAASRGRLAEREKAEGVARIVRALLSAEDPWTAPAERALALDDAGNPALPGPRTYEVRISGTALCVGGAAPADNAALPPPGGCPGGVRAVRRWHVVVAFPSLYADAGRDSVVSILDVESGSSSVSAPFEGITP